METDTATSRSLKKSSIIVLTIIVLAVVVYFYYSSSLRQDSGERSTSPHAELGNAVPSDFPSGLFTGGGVPLAQSYTVDYPGQRRSTIVFVTEKTIAEIQELYTTYLVDNQWAILNNAVDTSSVSFYAKKGVDDMNIAATSRSATTEVSISILRSVE